MEVKKENFDYKVEKNEGGKVKVSISVTPDYFVKEKDAAFNKLKVNVTIKGFRAGMAPKNLIEAKLGPTLFEETINRILPKAAMEILQKENLNPINQLHYHLEKVSEAEGLHYHIEFEVIPEFKLPELSKIKVKKEEVKISKDEVGLVIKDMFERANAASMKDIPKVDKDTKKDAKKEEKGAKEETLKMDDKWAVSLGIPSVKTLKDLEKEVEVQLKNQKTINSEEKYKADLLDEIVKKAGITVPASLVEREISNREEDYRKRIENVGLKFEEFLKSRQTTLEELKKGWEEDAKVRIAREVLLVEIAKTHNVTVTKEDIEKELVGITDPELKKQYDSQQGRNYIATVLIQQRAVEKILELAGVKKVGDDAGRSDKKEKVAMTN